MMHSMLVTYSVVCLAVPWSSPPGRASSHGGGGGVGGPSSMDGDVAMSSYEPPDLGDRLQVGWCMCVLMILCMSICTIVALTESSNSAVFRTFFKGTGREAGKAEVSRNKGERHGSKI